ncbi:hypothetical protein QYM36_005911 [Artemia franciscana]|uniref:Uncharacterized protein n=1 Tax=Artemia franciscana TaxID=6661 RepID=A0AA88HVB1_ARTSF|nr:hypothetical protein QYM36_005911 [Artemia franciscana]
MNTIEALETVDEGGVGEPESKLSRSKSEPIESTRDGVSKPKVKKKIAFVFRFKAKKLGETLALSPGEFQKHSTLRNDYKPLSPSRPYLHRNNTNLQMDGELSSITHTGEKYRGGTGDRYPPKKLKEVLEIPRGEMEKLSTFNNDYRQISPTRPYLHRNDTELKLEGGVEKISHSHQAYRNGPGVRYDARKLGETLKVDEGEIAKTTTTMGDFSPQNPRRPFLYRNNTNLHMEGGVEGNSHYDTIYKSGSGDSWPAKKLGYTLGVGEGGMQLDSTIQTDFPPLPVNRPVIKRLGSSLKTGGEFDGVTGYSQTYKEFTVERPKVKKMVDNLTISKGKLITSPVMRSDFKKFISERPTLSRLQTNLEIESGEIDFNSVNKVSFKPFVYAKQKEKTTFDFASHRLRSSKNTDILETENTREENEKRSRDFVGSNVSVASNSIKENTSKNIDLALSSEPNGYLTEFKPVIKDREVDSKIDSNKKKEEMIRTNTDRYVSKDQEEYSKHILRNKNRDTVIGAGVRTNNGDRIPRRDTNKTGYKSSIILGGSESGFRVNSSKPGQRNKNTRPTRAMKFEGDASLQPTLRSDFKELTSPCQSKWQGYPGSKDEKERRDAKSVLGEVIHKSDFSGLPCPAGFLEMPAKTKFEFRREKGDHKFYLPIIR